MLAIFQVVFQGSDSVQFEAVGIESSYRKLVGAELDIYDCLVMTCSTSVVKKAI